MATADELRGMIAHARNIVAFTGAGISTESGIPDFRSPGGLWTKYQPIEFGDFLASAELRRESLAAQVRHGRCDAEGNAQCRPSRSGAAHRAGQDGRGDHAEHRRVASGIRRPRRQGDRVARQRHLREMPRLQPALRARLGAGDLRHRRAASSAAAPAAASSRPPPSPSARPCRKTPWSAPGRPRWQRTSSLFWAARLWCIPPPGFRSWPSATDRASSSSIASRRSRTTWPISSSMPRSARR